MRKTKHNYALVKEIYERSLEQLNGIDRRWIKSEYEKSHGIPITDVTLSRYITEIRRSTDIKSVLKSTRKARENKEPRQELEILQDGTQKLLAYRKMSEEQSKDPDFVMKVNGYDPSKWDLVRLRVNEWTARNADNEELYNYQIRLDVKPKEADSLTLEDIIKANKEYSYKHKPISFTPNDNHKAIEIGIADLHIGSISFDEFLYKQKVSKIREKVNSLEIEKVYVVWYGDIIHVNDSSKQTNRGTQLETVGTVYDMFQNGKDILDYTISMFADAYKVETIWVQGNHSRDLEYALFDGTKDRWLNNKHVTFDVSESLRKAFLYGKQLVGLYHGDLPKSQTFDWLARDFKKLWGKAKYVEQHSGHYHVEKVETKAGIVSRTLTTIKETDGYEDSLAYKNISRVIQTFVYDKEEGLKQINYW